MDTKYIILSYFIYLLSFLTPYQATNDKQSQYFSLMKDALSGRALSDWKTMGEASFCNYTGITCNREGEVTRLNVSGWDLEGSLPPNICFYLPKLRALDISSNSLKGGFPNGITNCSLLEELGLGYVFLSGSLPVFSGMNSIRKMDFSYNLFTGDFPMSIFELTQLEELNFNENVNLNLWELPDNITHMTGIKTLILSTVNIRGRIPPSLGNMTSLVDLELSGNYLSGQIPPELGNLKNLKYLMLYYNQHLSGKIPEELGNLTELEQIDVSVNQLTGIIPDSICRLPKLSVLQLYNNSISGEIPASLGDSNTLRYFSVYENFLSGRIPRKLGSSSPMIATDLSENNFSGTLPPDIGAIPIPLLQAGFEESFLGNPGVCVTQYLYPSDRSFPLCSGNHRSKSLIWICITIALAIILVVTAALLLKCCLLALGTAPTSVRSMLELVNRTVIHCS